MASSTDTLNRARGMIGQVGEHPAGSNCNYVTEWFGSVGNMGCYSWCAAFVSFVLAHAGVAYAKQASCWFAIQAYRNGTNGEWLGNPGPGGIRPGDQGFLGSVGQDHTFLVEYVDGDYVVTIEGNWGNEVRRNRRAVSSIYGFGRPNYDGAAAPDLPPPSVTGGRPVLRLYSSGDSVRTLQTFLNGAGYDCGAVDGDFGTQTEGALEAYQRARGLTVDGECGPETWGDIDRVIAWVVALNAPHPPAQVGNVPAFPGLTKLGSHGDAVVKVQYVLISRGWNLNPGGADGIFGRQTDQVVRSYQAEKGLTVDGIVGPQTWVSMCTAPVT